MLKEKWTNSRTKVVTILSLMCLFFSESALGHGPSRQKVSEKIIINASPEKVWEIVSNFSDFTWNTEVKSSKSNDNKIGSLRTLTLENNQQIIQSLEKLDPDKRKISWRVQQASDISLPVNSYQATLIIKDKEGKTEITYRAGFYRGFMGNDPPEELNDENSKKKVKLFIESALKGLKSVSEK